MPWRWSLRGGARKCLGARGRPVARRGWSGRLRSPRGDLEVRRAVAGQSRAKRAVSLGAGRGRTPRIGVWSARTLVLRGHRHQGHLLGSGGRRPPHRLVDDTRTPVRGLGQRVIRTVPRPRRAVHLPGSGTSDRRGGVPLRGRDWSGWGQERVRAPHRTSRGRTRGRSAGRSPRGPRGTRQRATVTAYGPSRVPSRWSPSPSRPVAAFSSVTTTRAGWSPTRRACTTGRGPR